MTTQTIALASKMRPDAQMLADIVSRAWQGDQEALIYVFDNVFYDVYHDVFLATHSRRKAERVTRDALERLPDMVRRGRHRNVEELRASLLKQAERRIRVNRSVGVPVGGLERLRAIIRRVVLFSSATIVATGALILVM